MPRPQVSLQKLDPEQIGPEAMMVVRAPASAAEIAAMMPASPAPSTKTSVSWVCIIVLSQEVRFERIEKRAW